MNNDVGLLIFVAFSFGLVIVRLDRLGKQVEAFSAQIRQELAPDPLRKEEILNEWRASQTEAAKNARRFWMFWGTIGAVFLVWLIMRRT